MDIAIIIGTHGSASEQLLKTTEMILGKQDNVACTDFFPGENTETLINKYNTHILKLKTQSGLLFLVDLWGGSPFNAAQQIIIGKKNCDIVTGVNIPMLTEIFMAQEDHLSLKKLVQIAINNGKAGIKNINHKNTHTVTSVESTDEKVKYNHNINQHMTIELARIDDRLIHGQIVTQWTKASKIQRIIVINDEVANDTIRKTLLTQVAPPGITAHVISISKAIRVYNNPKYAQDRVMLLFTNPTDVVRLIEGGVKIHSVNIGGMAYQKEKIQINNAISVNQEDINSFKKLNEYGVTLEIRKISSDTPLNMMDLIKKLKK
ncbi:PTS mannose transporter subunit IIAB [Blochmannia endosymbiont of Polyrhachis (Hedomyrma) turneri]|uniref:PTS mannose transporter subunit IIAB n=1 Tax=Blochmannia endosymbiont of Polyrhachis (Hedomyrma) turneri TaxID=1505596 RepID=UPI00061A7A8C|nr:PTS mannose transporter subunit IIAB [Blochmannia endosymbiont of Polyrhachis (Hedomyrma) turneri]AKC60009.1 PTS system mannose-specific EIIAB component [Blochmannia endosymbiont of Polyrhachis (Hedomyrma) turneri]